MVPIGFGIQDKTLKTFAFVYPNPSNGNIHVLLPESGTGSFTYSVYDMTGRLLQLGTMDGAGDKTIFPIDLTYLQKGIYLLKLDGDNASYENKLIIH